MATDPKEVWVTWIADAWDETAEHPSSGDPYFDALTAIDTLIDKGVIVVEQKDHYHCPCGCGAHMGCFLEFEP